MDSKIFEVLKRHKNALENTGIKVSRMILFGSYATGIATEHSDIDVVVISDDFERLNLLERLEIIGLALAKAKIMEPVEAIGYTKQEFASKGEGTFIGDEVKTKGVEIL